MAKSRRSRSRGANANAYLHGYSKHEQRRLYQQARFLESSVFGDLGFSGRRRIIEVGSGVGAQTEILLERLPNVAIDCVDASGFQIGTARRRLARAVRLGQVHLHVGSADRLPFAENTFDGAFLCWFLEHVQNPVEVLQEVRRVLSSGGRIFCNEVLNAGFFVHPYSPATLQYWFAFNDHQWNLKGDPFVGAKLGNYLIAAGYQNIRTRIVAEHYDNRMPKKRTQAIEYWTALLLSGAPKLLKAGKVSERVVDQMVRELESLKFDPDSVLFITFVQAQAEVF